jgi:hypothetical protein
LEASKCYNLWLMANPMRDGGEKSCETNIEKWERNDLKLAQPISTHACPDTCVCCHVSQLWGWLVQT